MGEWVAKARDSIIHQSSSVANRFDDSSDHSSFRLMSGLCVAHSSIREVLLHLPDVHGH